MKLPFREVWLCDTEYRANAGSRCHPVCLVALEYFSRREIRLWWDELVALSSCPFSLGNDSLFIAYSAPAEFGTFLQLGWQLPLRVLDLFAEFRALRNNTAQSEPSSLLDAMRHYGLSAIDCGHKDSMRELILNNEEYSAEERVAILDYCAEDVYALAQLLPAMLSEIDLPRALFRGRYQCAVARMEFNGIPLDMETLPNLQNKWDSIKEKLVREIDSDFGVFDGLIFKRDRFADWLSRNNIAWPFLESGELDLTEETFRERAKADPRVAPLHELRVSLSKLKLNDLSVGEDGRNRASLMPFRSKTGRNQPSNTKFIFGPSTWIRGLIKPEEGRAIAYIDWSSQELGIAASLSNDPAMIAAYEAGDFYLAFAKMAKAVPENATKGTHPAEREKFKVVSLGVLFGLSEHGLASKLGVSVVEGKQLLRLHRQTFPQFWKWTEGVTMEGSLSGRLNTVFGWPIRVIGGFRTNTLKNFPVQGTGADMMRLATCLTTEQGIQVCCPIHDALLIESLDEKIEEDVAIARGLMAEASRAILKTLTLRTDAKIVRFPERYMDPRGEIMWGRVNNLVS